MIAVWNSTVLAESDETVVVEGNHYFPPDSVNWDYFSETDLRTTCPWKGEATYYSIKVNGDVAKNAAWAYPEPKEKAEYIKNYVSFYGHVDVS